MDIRITVFCNLDTSEDTSSYVGFICADVGGQDEGASLFEGTEETDESEDELIAIPDDVELTPDILTNESLKTVIKSVNFFNGEPSNFLDYIVSLELEEFDLLIDEVNDELIRFIKELKSYNECVKFIRKYNRHHETIYNLAIQYSSMYMFKWAHLRGFKTYGVLQIAVEDGNLEFVKYAFENKFEYKTNLINVACINGNVDCVAYLHKKGIKWTNITGETCCSSGSLDCLKYVYEHGCEVSPESIDTAAKFGNIDCIEYLLSVNFKLTVETMKKAVYQGGIETIIYLREKGCPWDKSVTKYAFELGEYDHFMYLYNNRCPTVMTKEIRQFLSERTSQI